MPNPTKTTRASKPKPNKQSSKLAVIQTVPRSVQYTMLAAFIGGLLFVSPYFGALVFSALIAFIFNPVYKWVLRRTKRVSLAICATFAAAIISVLIPITIVATVTIVQAGAIIADFQEKAANIGTAQIDEAVDRGTDRVNKLIASVPGGEPLTLDKQKIADTAKSLATDLIQGLVNFIKKTSGAVATLISTSILSIFLIVGMLRYQEELIEFIKNLSPFHREITEDYLEKTGAMTKAMVKGQIIIAVCQGFASTFSLWLVGVNYFGFFFMLLSFMSFIPLGAGIITIPIGIVYIITGNIWQGIFIILWHIFVVSNIDNLLRPRLVPKNARLNSGVLLLAVFSGLAAFGAAGVVLGPVFAILIITTFQMYAEYNKRIIKPLPPDTAGLKAGTSTAA